MNPIYKPPRTVSIPSEQVMLFIKKFCLYVLLMRGATPALTIYAWECIKCVGAPLAQFCSGKLLNDTKASTHLNQQIEIEKEKLATLE